METFAVLSYVSQLLDCWPFLALKQVYMYIGVYCVDMCVSKLYWVNQLTESSCSSKLELV